VGDEVETDHKLRLAAVLAADVAGFTRLMADDERATMASLEAARAVFGEHVAANSGRIVDTAGDSVLALFDNAAGAVQAALAVQSALEQPAADARAMRFRIGIHLGDINEKPDGTIYGDGVNIAARLEGLAKPGRIAVSEAVHGALRGRIDVGFAALGKHSVKNVAEPVLAFEVTQAGEKAPVAIRRKGVALASAAVLAATVLALVLWLPGSDDLAEVEAEPDSATAMPPLPQGPKIAVMPFENLSEDPAQEIFSDGLTEDISIALSRFQNLFVIAPQSTMRYKGQAIDIPVVGSELGVEYVLLGSVRQVDARIRITVKMLDVEDQTQAWGETYDRDLNTKDIFTIQDDIADNVASSLGGEMGRISRDQGQAHGISGNDDLEAYGCVLRAQSYFNKLTPDEHLIVRDCLEGTVADNPIYAQAWAWLAYMYREEVVSNFNLQTDLAPPLDRALEAAQRSVALAPDLQLGHDVLASVYFNRNELDLFLPEAEKAIALNPNSSRTVAWMGSMMALTGDWEYGISWLRRAMALNPHHAGWYQLILGNYYYSHKRDFEQALREYQKANMPGFFWWHIHLAKSYGQLGRMDEAEAELSRIIHGSVEYGW